MAEKIPGINLSSGLSGQPGIRLGGPVAPADTSSDSFGIKKLSKKQLAGIKTNAKAAQPKGQDFLGWLGDILSRPLYGITNVVHDAINTAVDVNTGKKSLADEFAANPLGPGGSFLAGMFSTNPDTHRSTSQLIEGTTDKFGTAFNPDYHNTKDNVNPWLKGTLGFAGDVALDPLTWLPGIGLLNVGSKTARAANDISKAIQAENVVDTAVSKATEKAVTPTGLTGEGAKNVAAKKVENQAALENPGAAALDDSMGQDLLSRLVANDPQAGREFAQMQVANAIQTPKALAAQTALKGLTSGEVQGMARAVADVSSHEPLSYANWVKEVNTKLDTLSQKELDTLKIPGMKHPVTGKKMSFGQIMLDAENPEDIASAMAKRYHSEWYRKRFQQGKSEGKLLDALTQEVKPEVPVSKGAVETTTSAIENFRQAHALDEPALRAALGDELVDNLRRMKSPAKFDAVMSRLSGILNGSVDVTTLRESNVPERMLLKQIGLEPNDIPVRFKPVKAVKNERTPLRTITEDDIKSAGLADDPTVASAQASAENVLKQVIKDQWVEPKKPFSSKNGALKSEAAYGSGSALWQHQFTTQTWYTVSKYVDKEVQKGLADAAKKSGRKLVGQPRALLGRQLYLNTLRLVERKLDDMGIPLTMGLNEDRYPLTLSQVLEHLDNVNPQLMQRVFWNKGSQVAPTGLMDAVTAAVRGRIPLSDGEIVKGSEGIGRSLRQTTTKYTNADGSVTELPNNLVKPTSVSYAAKGVSRANQKLNKPQLLNDLEKLIKDESGHFRNMVEANAGARLERIKGEAYTLADNKIKELTDLYHNAQGPGDIIRGIEDITPSLRQDAAAMGATPEAEKLAEEGVKAHIPDEQIEHAESLTNQTEKVTSKVATATTPPRQAVEEAVRGTQSYVRNRWHQAFLDWAKSQEFVAGGTTTDIGKQIKEVFNQGWWTKLNTVFNTSYGQPLFRDAVRAAESLWRVETHRYQASLHAIEKLPGATPEAIREAYAAIRVGVQPTNPTVAAIYEPLKDAVVLVHGRAGGSLLDSPFFRENISLEQANRMLEFYHSDFLFDLASDPATQAFKKDGIKAIADQWSKYDPEDVIEHLNKSYLAFSKSTMDQSLADQFIDMTRQLGALSSKPRPGWTRFADDSGKSTFAPYLPNDVYVHPLAMRQFQVVDAFSRDLLERKGPVWEFVRDYYQPMLDMWKYGMTLPNPTHHFRNLWSDMSLTFLADGAKGFRSAHTKAFQALATHNGYDNYDFIKALQGVKQVPHDGKVLSKIRVGGKPHEITASDYYQAAMDRGNMPTFQQLEQLGFEGPEAAEKSGRLATSWSKFTATKGVKALGNVSEARDHYVRMAHFIMYVEKHANDRGIKSLDQLFDRASEQVRKWHPDGSDLTNAERTFKLIIPFYSWTRHAIPLITEAILTKPARITMFSKASYNLAVAMGVNPHSLSDPWPEDGTFPSYLTNQEFGPQFNIGGKLFSVSPGIAPWDVLDQTVAGNPLQNVLGQTTPAIRMPFEIATGTQAGTGAPITDWSDYVDSQIPGVGQLSRITGVSPTGTAASLLTGNGQLDMQHQIAKGNKLPGLGFVNWLTGAGIQQVNQPNQIKYAQLEQRNNGGKI